MYSDKLFVQLIDVSYVIIFHHVWESVHLKFYEFINQIHGQGKSRSMYLPLESRTFHYYIGLKEYPGMETDCRAKTIPFCYELIFKICELPLLREVSTVILPKITMRSAAAFLLCFGLLVSSGVWAKKEDEYVGVV